MKGVWRHSGLTVYFDIVGYLTKMYIQFGLNTTFSVFFLQMEINQPFPTYMAFQQVSRITLETLKGEYVHGNA